MSKNNENKMYVKFLYIFCKLRTNPVFETDAFRKIVIYKVIVRSFFNVF